jgi:hypothetical protein
MIGEPKMATGEFCFRLMAIHAPLLPDPANFSSGCLSGFAQRSHGRSCANKASPQSPVDARIKAAVYLVKASVYYRDRMFFALRVSR